MRQVLRVFVLVSEWWEWLPRLLMTVVQCWRWLSRSWKLTTPRVTGDKAAR